MSLQVEKDEERGRIFVGERLTEGENSEVILRVTGGASAEVLFHFSRKGELVRVEIRGVRFASGTSGLPEPEKLEEAEPQEKCEECAEPCAVGPGIAHGGADRWDEGSSGEGEEGAEERRESS